MLAGWPDAGSVRVAMTMSGDGLTAAERKMREDAQPEEAIRSFRNAYERLAAGHSPMIRTSDLEPAGDVPTLVGPDDDEDNTGLDGFVVIKLNGGLATINGSPGSRSPCSRPRTAFRSWTSSSARPLALRKRYGVEPAAAADEQRRDAR